MAQQQMHFFFFAAAVLMLQVPPRALAGPAAGSVPLPSAADPWGALDGAEAAQQEIRADPDILLDTVDRAAPEAGGSPGLPLGGFDASMLSMPAAAPPAARKGPAPKPLHTSRVMANMKKRNSGYQPSAHEVIAMVKGFEQVSALSTKPLCMHYAKVNEAKGVEDLVSGFDVFCSNLMSHRHGFYGAHIVALPVGKMVCRHAHAYLQTMKAPTESLGTNPSLGETCGAFQEMIKGAVAHLADQERVTETLAEIGNLRLKQKHQSLTKAKDNLGKKYYKMHEL